MVYRDRIEIDPAICSGKPVIRGTRILVTSILSQLSAGESFAEIRKGFPGLSDDDLRASLEFSHLQGRRRRRPYKTLP